MKIEQKDHGLTVRLEGELGHHEALSALGSLENLIDTYTPAELTLDFSGVSFMDSSGIALVVQSARQLQSLGGKVTVCGVAKQAMRVFSAAGIQKLVRFTGGSDQ